MYVSLPAGAQKPFYTAQCSGNCQAQHDINHQHDAIGFDKMKPARGGDIGFRHQINNGDGVNQRGVFNQIDQHAGEVRQCGYCRLRKNNASETA